MRLASHLSAQAEALQLSVCGAAAAGSFSEEGLEWGPASNAAGLSLAAHRYKNKAASSMLLLRGQGASK